jgi:hypothetical protein
MVRVQLETKSGYPTTVMIQDRLDHFEYFRRKSGLTCNHCQRGADDEVGGLQWTRKS